MYLLLVLTRGGMFNNQFKMLLNVSVKEFWKIGEYLTKLRNLVAYFLDHRVVAL